MQTELCALLSAVRESIINETPDCDQIQALQQLLTNYQAIQERQRVASLYHAALSLAKDAGFASLQDLIAVAEGKPASVVPPNKPSRIVKPLYQDDAGNTWSGRGKPARWLQDRLNAGASLDDFRI